MFEFEHWHGGFERFSQPGFKFLACSYSDRECQEGKRVRYRSWESLYLLAVLFRGSKPSSFCQYWDFSNIYRWFWNIFIFLFLSTFAVAMLWFAFCSVVCCLRVLWFWCLGESHRSNPLLLLCSSFLYKKESFLKPDDVLTWYFSCSWAHRFVVFVFLSFFDFIILLLVAVSSIFGCYHFLTRWCWVDEGSFDSWGSSMRFCFLCQRGWTDIFPFAGIW